LIIEIQKHRRKDFLSGNRAKSNNGATVKFALTTFKDNEFVFENPEHDFPKKIVCKKVSATEMFAQVLGEGGKGYSFKMVKL